MKILRATNLPDAHFSELVCQVNYSQQHNLDSNNGENHFRRTREILRGLLGKLTFTGRDDKRTVRRAEQRGEG
jgi:hypothetical protein